MKMIRFGSVALEKYLTTRTQNRPERLIKKVARIVEDVRVGGDTALLKYTRKFDRVKLLPRDLQVSEEEINACYQNIKPEFAAALRVAVENVRTYYKSKIVKSLKVRTDDGVRLSEHIRPMNTVGVYVPSGTVPLVSTVYMTVIPAQAAGVKNIYITTPPGPDGRVDPHILAVANLLKVSAIYKAGGAQAVAAMAFGTKTIPQADKIIGPGNQYVAEAKRQVFGYCDIDMIAGPTELVVIANEHTDPQFVAADLMAQSEHHGGSSILITTSKRLAKQMARLPIRGFIVRVKNLEQGVELSNRIAPEHLEIMVKRPERLLRCVENAGAVFLGPYSPTAVGDYVAGPSHVLPTNGSARFFSGLGVQDFLKNTHVISYSRKALERVRSSAEYIANLEGLKKHYESIKVRFEPTA
ncbi:MAG: histidinol dehydrogenase [Candidatus Omnitrophica bacterium]|jgi:histidinol dehydrogenase|nr:histidinol dehydrogenase [Candidatus Omnitrophota bacterium]